MCSWTEGFTEQTCQKTHFLMAQKQFHQIEVQTKSCSPSYFLGRSVSLNHQNSIKVYRNVSYVRMLVKEIRGVGFSTRKCLPSLCQNSDPEGKISKSFINCFVMDYFSPNFSKFFKPSVCTWKSKSNVMVYSLVHQRWQKSNNV